MSSTIDISVVIGFRDWGAERINRSAQSIIDSFGNIRGELIISDYGSVDASSAKRVAEELGCKYVYTPGDPDWSRSRALNAGFAIAEGDILVSTDADMLFSLRSMQRIVETAREADQCALFLQCRDLPEDMGDEYFADQQKIDWTFLEEKGRLRPRWGMGGMMAISRRGFEILRGFDERLHTYGGEDLDFAQRARRAGYRTVWVDHPEVRMYHMWHPPTRRVVEQSEAGRTAVAFNRDVVYNDKTYARNPTKWTHKPDGAAPLVTVQFATRGRPELLREAIISALFQTVQDFEIIVVDDGSEDDATKRVVEEINDPRITYVWQKQAGISAARNCALDLSRGVFTAIMDDDDLMPAQRLEWQIASLSAEYVGTSGSFVNFDNESGDLELIVSRIPTFAQAAEKGGAPGHGTWMIRTDVMKALRYDENITSGVDNNFFLRLLRSGYRVTHCGKPVLMRRRHSAQVTVKDSGNQGDTAKQTLQYFQHNLANWHKAKLAEEATASGYPKTPNRGAMIDMVRAFLPDHLVQRDASVRLDSVDAEIPQFDRVASRHFITRDGSPIVANLDVRHASLNDLVILAQIGEGLEVVVSGPDTEAPELGRSRPDWLELILEDYMRDSEPGAAIALFRDSRDLERVDGVMYDIEDASHHHSIYVKPFDRETAAITTPWLVVGCTAKEYWA
ncbi:hypothetical protein GCM10028787_06140 [Brachybacterium horti]